MVFCKDLLLTAVVLVLTAHNPAQEEKQEKLAVLWFREMFGLDVYH